MKFRNAVHRGLGALLIVGSASLAMPAPADAACVVAYVAVHYQGTPDQVIVDPSQCLVPTPFPNYPFTADAGYNGNPVAPGAPTGFSFQVWVPA